MNRFHLALAAGVVATATANAAVLYTTNFETDQSSNFTVVTSTADTEANFNFDYSTWTPTAPTAGIASIPAAPSASGTRGLKLRSNFDATGTNEAVTAFVNASAGKSNWTLTFDAFQLWNGPADVSGTGTTTAMTFGNANTSFPLYTAPATFNGWFVSINGEGGSGTDARFYSAASATPAVDNSIPNWFNNGTADVNMEASTNWQGVFAAPNYPEIGTPGRQWVKWKIVATGGLMVISVTPVGGTETQVSSFARTANQTVGIGFWDLFTGSIADPPADNFVVIDNLTLEEPDPIAGAGGNWAVYE